MRLSTEPPCYICGCLGVIVIVALCTLFVLALDYFDVLQRLAPLP